MQLLVSIWALVQDRYHTVFNNGAPYGPVFMLGALAMTVLFYVDKRRARGRRLSVSGFIRTIFPARIVWHPSSRLDMRLWCFNTLLFASGYGTLALGALFWRDATVASLTTLLGAHEPTVWPLWLVFGMATAFELLAYEFGYWSAHYAFHAFPALWEFHKVHHSAEVMTTFTEMRTHPVEIVAFMNVIAFFTGIVFGMMTYTFGPGIHAYTLLNLNVGLMLFLITVGHLRHSHLWIAFTGLAGRLMQSPAHHQIHHSNQPRHFNRNLGFALAVWDWAFGTLYVPEQYEKITFGVGAAHVDFDTVVKTWLLPFVRAGSHIRNWTKGPGAPSPESQPVAMPAKNRSTPPQRRAA
jgi:sterol desaturase/sphingolipid hydroxylase (fatty acid hydroxylase superfamily)